MKGKFEDTKEIHPDIVSCLTKSVDEKVYKKIINYWEKAKTADDFIDAVILTDDPEVYCCYSYEDVYKRYQWRKSAEAAFDKMINRIVETRGLNTQRSAYVADAGFCKIVLSDTATINILNGYGDGIFHVYVFDTMPGVYNTGLFEFSTYFTIFDEDNVFIANYDCEPLGSKTKIKFKRGNYAVYSKASDVFIERVGSIPWGLPKKTGRN